MTPLDDKVSSSQCCITKSPAILAYSSARRINPAFITARPSSETPRQPERLRSIISVICTPSRPLVIAPTGYTLTRFTFSAWSRTNWTTWAVSIAGEVLGMQKIDVNPPLAAARQPLSIVSLSSRPGSRKCTCRSINPGRTFFPAASMTCRPSPLIPSEIFTILPSSIKISAGLLLSPSALTILAFFIKRPITAPICSCVPKVDTAPPS